MSVKRHSICGTINTKVRHIYDVTRLYNLDEIQTFLRNTEELKRLVKLTKETDAYYLDKRDIPKNYNPLDSYNFHLWRDKLDHAVKERYETLHIDLLYTDEVQNFDMANDVFNRINETLQAICE